MPSCKCRTFLLFSIIFILVLAFAPGIPPHVPFTYFELEDALPLTGALSYNNVLDDAEQMFKGHLQGPESIASRKPEEIFVGVHDGSLVKIFGNDFDSLQVVYHGKSCSFREGEKCDRPLGLRFAPNGKLLVADAYVGILEVDVDTGEKKILVDSSVPISGRRPLIPDDLDVDKDGNIYWSDASSNFFLDSGFLDLVSSASGRLFKYDPKTKKNHVLVDDLHFANGVQLSPDESFVLVDECFRNRVIRYWLKGPKAGTSDVFASGLPGMPDNLRARPEGGYYVSLVASNPWSVELHRRAAKFPTVRKVLTRMCTLVKCSIDWINSFIQSETIRLFNKKIVDLSTYTSISNHMIAVVVLGEDGSVIDSLQGPGEKISRIAETSRVGKHLFFGSPYNDYLGRISIDALKAESSHKATDKHPKEEL